MLVQGMANYTGTSVRVDDLYLPVDEAITFANALAPSSVGYTIIAIGFWANRWVGAALSLAYQQASDLAAEIRELTDDGHAVRIEFIRDPWGTDVVVHYWNNRDKWSMSDYSQGRYQYQFLEYTVLDDVVTEYNGWSPGPQSIKENNSIIISY